MRKTFVLAVSALMVCSVQATAQSPVHVLLGGGVTFPQNGDAGWNAVGGLALTTLMQPMGLRAEVGYNQFDSGGATSATTKVVSATANLTYRLPMTNSPLSPYLITGAGAYKTSCSTAAACVESTRIGWNIGAGTKLNLAGLVTFAEARYNSTRHARYTALTAGLFF
jgi:hypothetical protein